MTKRIILRLGVLARRTLKLILLKILAGSISLCRRAKGPINGFEQLFNRRAVRGVLTAMGEQDVAFVID